MIALHNGNRGFGEQLGVVVVVISDLRHWNDVAERNQGFVDGGMFAMILALACSDSTLRSHRALHGPDVEINMSVSVHRRL